MRKTDHPQDPMSPEELVRLRLARRRLFEARFLLKRLAPDMGPVEVEQLRQEIRVLVKKVNRLAEKAEDRVRQGSFDDALAAYEQVRLLAVDYPGLDSLVQQVEVQRSFGVSGDGDAQQEKNHREANRKEVSPRQMVDAGSSPGAGKDPRPALLAGVFGLVVCLLAAFWLFHGADTKDVAGLAKHVEPRGKIFSRQPASPASQVAGKRQGNTTEPVLLAKKIITPPITASLPVPELAETGDNRVTTRQETENKVSGSMVPLPVFVAGQPEIQARFIPQALESESKGVSAGQQHVAGRVPEKITAAQQPDSSAPASVPETNNVSLNQDHLAHPGATEQQGDTSRSHQVRTEKGVHDNTGVYIVKEGESLKGIAKNVYGRPERWFCLVQANTELLPDPPYRIAPGMRLVVPTEQHCQELAEAAVLNPDGTYTVQSGDNLGKIAAKFYGTSRRWQELFDLNRDILPTAASLRVGQRLKIWPEQGKKRVETMSEDGARPSQHAGERQEKGI